MKYIKLFLLALLVTVLSLITNPISAKTLLTNSTQNFINSVSPEHTVEYVVIDGHTYVIHYDEDGKIMQILPAD
jgi:hypothetical protein